MKIQLYSIHQRFQNRRAKFRRNERSVTGSTRASSVSSTSSSSLSTTSPQKPLIEKPSLHQFDFPPPYSLSFGSLGMFQSPTPPTNIKNNELNYGNTFNPYTQYQQNYNNYCTTNFRYKTPY